MGQKSVLTDVRDVSTEDDRCKNIHLVKVTRENKNSVEAGPSRFSKKQTAIHDNVLLCMLSFFFFSS